MSKKTSVWRKSRSIEYREQKLDSYYIFCEGERTEPNYFEGFKKVIEDNPIYKNMILIDIEPRGVGTIQVIEEAEKYVHINDITDGQVWCVYDKDSFTNEDFNKADERVSFLNSKNNNLQYHTAWSNECIEFWFILHFYRYTSNNSRAEYISFLNREFKKLKVGDYKKKRKDIFEILIQYGDPKMAIRFASQIIEDNQGKQPSEIAPGTKVYELVKELAKYLPDAIREKFL